MHASERSRGLALLLVVPALWMGLALADEGQALRIEQQRVARLREQLEAVRHSCAQGQSQRDEDTAGLARALAEARAASAACAQVRARQQRGRDRQHELEQAARATGAAALTQSLAQARSALEQAQARVLALESALASATARATEADARARAADSATGACLARNAALHRAGLELLEAYRTQGPLERARRLDPFLQFGAVDRENAVQDWRDRLDAGRVLTPPR